MSGPFDHFSMRDLFRIEAQVQSQALVAGLLALEQDARSPEHLEACMRAAHSLKGAARLVDIGAGVIVAHNMEELFVAAQANKTVLSRAHVDMLLKGVDLLTAIGEASPDEDSAFEEAAERYVADLSAALAGDTGPAEAGDPPPQPHAPPTAEPGNTDAPPDEAATAPAPTAAAEPMATGNDARPERSMRVNAEHLGRLLDLAGEALVESRRLNPMVQAFQRLKQMQLQVARSAEAVREALGHHGMNPAAEAALSATERAMHGCREFLGERLAELEAHDSQSTALAHRLYGQALKVRMRPFSDGVAAFPRMVRDVGKSLGKHVRLEISGLSAQIDRDILERLDAPLGHLLRNAVDHGIEAPDERAAAGKPAEAVVRLDAHHSAGTLQIIISDDGAGIDTELIRRRVVARKLADPHTAERLSEAELLEFLFLPGFTMKDEVSQLSGRGVGLDVVRHMVKQVGGLVSLTSKPGKGTRFQLQLPLTLSVIRALLVDVGHETYAFSFGQVVRAIRLPRAEVSTVEGRQYFNLEGRSVALVSARQILDCEGQPDVEDTMAVVLIGGAQALYGVVVDRFVGARELVVKPLDPRLGKIRNISAGAVTEDGMPLLIIDADDMVQSMEKLARFDRLTLLDQPTSAAASRTRAKRVLVVDDSFTVRELQRKLLTHHGYEVELAVDGKDGWNILRGGEFDLVVTDVDMPRMDGIELVEMIRQDRRLASLPVMILSYKDREDDRQRGLEAGADYYLTKGSYQSDALIEAVIDLIGQAQP